MGKFKKDIDKGIPQVNTSALPDIIFMLLFFFMVATTMKEVDMQVKIDKPVANQAEKIEDKDMVDFIYIGFPLAAKDEENPVARIQLDDEIVKDYSDVKGWKRRKVRPGMDVFDIVTSLKVDEKVGMRLVSQVKEALRDINALKINYSADQTD